MAASSDRPSQRAVSLSASSHQRRPVAKKAMGLVVAGFIMVSYATGCANRSQEHHDDYSRTSGSRTQLAEVELGATAVPREFIIGLRPQTHVSEATKKFDPASDTGWDTEVLSAAASSQLRRLAKVLMRDEGVDAARLSDIVSNHFSCPALHPVKLTKIFDDTSVSIWRREDARDTEVSEWYRGAAGLGEALQELLGSLNGSGGVRAKFKVVRIDLSDQFFTTQVLLEADRRHADGAVQQNAVWSCRWTLPDADDAGQPWLLSISPGKYEQVVLKTGQGLLFEDCTESAMRHSEAYAQQVLPGIDHWLTRITRISGINLFAPHGLAVGDVNGDELEDVYVCDSGGLPNRLYVQNLDVTVTDHIERCRRRLDGAFHIGVAARPGQRWGPGSRRRFWGLDYVFRKRRTWTLSAARWRERRG